MYQTLGNRLIKCGELVATLDKDQMIQYLLEELNEYCSEFQSIEDIQEELEEAQEEISMLNAEINELQEELGYSL